MSFAGRFFSRIIARVFWLIVLVSTLTFLISDVPEARWLGVLLFIFLLDKIIHRGEADKPLSELPSSGRANVAQYLEPKAFRAIEIAYEKALLRKSNFHLELLLALLKFGVVRDIVSRLDVKPEEFIQKIEQSLTKEISDKNKIISEIDSLLRTAFIEAVMQGGRFVDVLDVLAALGRTEDIRIKKLLAIFSLNQDDFRSGAAFGEVLQKLPRWRKIPRTISAFAFRGTQSKRHRVMNRAWTARPTPLLDRYSLDFSDIARAGHIGFMIGHRKEYGRMIETLSRSLNPNAILVGEVGSGKETIVAHLAVNLIKDNVPPALWDKRLVSLDISLLVASASPEELQDRLRKMVKEIEMAGNIILYIPDIHNLVRTSGTAYLSAADALMPVIMNNSFPVIGCTYPREWKELIEPRSDFAGTFEFIRVEEISEDEAERILIFEGLRLERITGIKVGLAAIKKAVSLAKKHFRLKMLPSSAEELLKAAFVKAEEDQEKFLTADSVIKVAEEKTNVPLRRAGREEAEKLLNLEDKIHERLVDQVEAVGAVAGSLREYRSGLTRKGGPIASFLFVGPTGVGKTELAKILAALEFGSEEAMLRFDMTEYQDKQSFIRFIGSPDQSVNGALTDVVRQKPYSLILLDEFEKAYPDILNLFLQVLDDGRLTDNEGRVVDFGNTIIIATSNAHSEFITESLREGKSMKDISEGFKRQLVDVFKPELLNRFSKIIAFKNLEPEELKQVAAINLRSLAALLKEQDVELSFEDDAVRLIAELGYDPAFGARPLRRAIDENIKSGLSEAILRGEIVPGDSVEVGVEHGKFTFKKS